jgi:hypothetical protein
MIVVSFYTNEKYRLHAEAMKASAEAVGLKCEITAKPDRGSWYLNCNQKSSFVLECLEKYGNEPVLWQDADTRFLSYPKLLDTLDADMAAFFYSPRVPIGGTLWFNGQRAKRYVQTWAKVVSDNHTREDDSINFRDALASIKNPRIQHLPPAYCWNEKSFRGSFPGVTEPVIVHGYAGEHDYPIMQADEPSPSP